MNWLSLFYMVDVTPLICYVVWRKAPVTHLNQPRSVTDLGQNVTDVTPILRAKPLQFWTVVLPDGTTETRCRDTETDVTWRLKARGMERITPLWPEPPPT